MDISWALLGQVWKWTRDVWVCRTEGACICRMAGESTDPKALSRHAKAVLTCYYCEWSAGRWVNSFSPYYNLRALPYNYVLVGHCGVAMHVVAMGNA